jgi:hypothetical protein
MLDRLNGRRLGRRGRGFRARLGELGMLLREVLRGDCRPGLFPVSRRSWASDITGAWIEDERQAQHLSS